MWERISRTIASIKNSPDFYVSHSTLADVENGSVPSIHKLFSLAVCLTSRWKNFWLYSVLIPKR